MDLSSLGYTQWDGCVVEFPCGNRFSTSQGTVPPITDTLLSLGYTQWDGCVVEFLVVIGFLPLRLLCHQLLTP